MVTYPISEHVNHLCQDGEWALVSVLLDRVVAVLCLPDIAPEIINYLDTPSAEFVVKRWAQTAPADLRELQALGDVIAGVVTENGFKPRWHLAEWRPGDQLPEEA